MQNKINSIFTFLFILTVLLFCLLHLLHENTVKMIEIQHQQILNLEKHVEQNISEIDSLKQIIENE